MKKLFAVFILLFLAVGVLSAQFAKGGTAWVSVKSVTLKSSTWFFASNKGTLLYGDEVSILQVSGSWVEVRLTRSTAITGWVTTSNLSGRRVVVTGGTGGASASELGLAGKGFNAEVENAYKADGNLNYADVDKTEAITVSDEELLRFMREGRLFTGDN